MIFQIDRACGVEGFHKRRDSFLQRCSVVFVFLLCSLFALLPEPTQLAQVVIRNLLANIRTEALDVQNLLLSIQNGVLDV
jgi:hypothetical protein